ncbi:Hypothetical protein A7982_09074 [Minicystis rosea]|nr:Hypothetical protein A7982_09074 [Minicystis rosea]
MRQPFQDGSARRQRRARGFSGPFLLGLRFFERGWHGPGSTRRAAATPAPPSRWLRCRAGYRLPRVDPEEGGR